MAPIAHARRQHRHVIELEIHAALAADDVRRRRARAVRAREEGGVVVVGGLGGWGWGGEGGGGGRGEEEEGGGWEGEHGGFVVESFLGRGGGLVWKSMFG
tara:strand:+ start:3983 stop:4282 length:300 start_codon:yes stop_codon:yes gene_type:complete